MGMPETGEVSVSEVIAKDDHDIRTRRLALGQLRGINEPSKQHEKQQVFE
jgi:hypothetical protein